ncbi:MAG TPA: CDP-alcohol phosphatidyltransferase family protein [Methylophilaceae bacterium]|jgi:CDP-diacylglycerol--glycerol-3-phosphate 3-phosphatidyltransferase
MKYKIPLALTLLRAFLAPVMVILALYHPTQVGFGVCVVAAFLSDLFDGIIARKLGIATPNLRRADSIADSIFYLSAIFTAWYLYPQAIKDHIAALAILVALEVIRYIFDYLKFRREASYHMWSSKLWGIFLFAGFFSLLALGKGGLPFTLAIYVGIIADIEGLAISAILKKPKTDVPSFIHALRF